MLSEPQRRRSQGSPGDVQGRQDDIRVWLLAQWLHVADSVELELDAWRRSVRLPARFAFGVRPEDRRGRRSDPGRLLGVFSGRKRRCPIHLHLAASHLSARRLTERRMPPRCRRRKKAPSGHMGCHQRPTEVSGRRHVALRGIQHAPLAAGPGNQPTTSVSSC